MPAGRGGEIPAGRGSETPAGRGGETPAAGSEEVTCAQRRVLAEVVAALPGLLARWRWDVEAVAALGSGGGRSSAGPEPDGLALLVGWYHRVCTDGTYQRRLSDAAVAALAAVELPSPAAAMVSRCRAAVRVAGELVACRRLLDGASAEPQRVADAVERLELAVGEALSRSLHPSSSGGGADELRRRGRRRQRG